MWPKLIKYLLMFAFPVGVFSMLVRQDLVERSPDREEMDHLGLNLGIGGKAQIKYGSS